MNKNTKVLALKYRPQTFNDLIGQDVVAETISNSIKANKVPNAYLFTGIRGIGKTTTARIVAKSLNCSNGIDNLCKEELCENCNAISNSNHIDVLEMDAASKTGVDDVRDLIEFSRYGPTTAKYKIFIIFFGCRVGFKKPFKIALFSDCLKVLILLTSRAMQYENILFKRP